MRSFRYLQSIRSVRWSLESHASVDGDRDLGSVAGVAPNPKARADAGGPLAHAGQATVSLAGRGEHLGRDAAAVVADHDVQASGCVLDLDGDGVGPGMAEGIHD